MVYRFFSLPLRLAIPVLLIATTVAGCAGLNVSVSTLHGDTSASFSISVPAPEGVGE